MRRMLASQPDFLAQKNRITELLESEGFLVIYVPKLHPELNRPSRNSLSIVAESVLTNHIVPDGSDRAGMVSNQGAPS